ncbi:hypothetical protein IQ249_03065 [Lusitaniella coriacea LEGE 07157]|uniref:Uncharacterized protein n=1 Tax=Lusitaniella coriacea LEGE 07157 TaxID=945747 RepID=A0A8J7B0F9_9CYAN|nr:hypothetical protein [Lusitaniella coriacea]MBE9114870.1 hypothetical protein [Lusitaniella coriacea LEGE 07157]
MVLQPNTSESASLTEDFLYFFSREVRPHHWVEVSVVTNSGVEVFYSKQATRRAIQNLRESIDGDKSTDQLDPTPSDKARLVEGLQRFSDRVVDTQGKHSIYFYMVTEGTTDPEAITHIREIAKRLSKQNLENAHLYILGLSSNNRLPLTAALAPIGDRVEFASADYDEWIQLLRKF